MAVEYRNLFKIIFIVGATVYLQSQNLANHIYLLLLFSILFAWDVYRITTLFIKFPYRKAGIFINSNKPKKRKNRLRISLLLIIAAIVSLLIDNYFNFNLTYALIIFYTLLYVGLLILIKTFYGLPAYEIFFYQTKLKSTKVVVC